MLQPTIIWPEFPRFPLQLEPPSGHRPQPPPHIEKIPLCQVFIFRSSTHASAPREAAEPQRSRRGAPAETKPQRADEDRSKRDICRQSATHTPRGAIRHADLYATRSHTPRGAIRHAPAWGRFS
jgi:hypothetical protein